MRMKCESKKLRQKDMIVSQTNVFVWTAVTYPEGATSESSANLNGAVCVLLIICCLCLLCTESLCYSSCCWTRRTKNHELNDNRWQADSMFIISKCTFVFRCLVIRCQSVRSKQGVKSWLTVGTDVRRQCVACGLETRVRWWRMRRS